jgi:hypothetical protein
VPSSDDQPDDAEPVTEGDEDPTERAEDGMAPFIANTGDDDSGDDDADASTG